MIENNKETGTLQLIYERTSELHGELTRVTERISERVAKIQDLREPTDEDKTPEVVPDEDIVATMNDRLKDISTQIGKLWNINQYLETITGND